MNPLLHKSIIMLLYASASLLSSIVMISCFGNNGMDGQLRLALEKAGENKGQIQHVLDHYRDDSLKLEAAKFLIVNMADHYCIS